MSKARIFQEKSEEIENSASVSPSRERQDPPTFVSANMVNPYSPYIQGTAGRVSDVYMINGTGNSTTTSTSSAARAGTVISNESLEAAYRNMTAPRRSFREMLEEGHLRVQMHSNVEVTGDMMNAMRSQLTHQVSNEVRARLAIHQEGPGPQRGYQTEHYTVGGDIWIFTQDQMREIERQLRILNIA